MTSHLQWLAGEIARWEREGVVDAASAARLRARYAAATARATARTVIGSLGALLLGLGVIALLAANWGVLSRGTRAAIAFTPLAGSAALAVAGFRRGWTSRGFLEPLGIFWGLAVGCGIALVAQTYQLPGDGGTFALAWTLLLLPVSLVTRAVAPLAGYFAGLLAWVSLAQLAGGVGLWFWPLAALGVPPILLLGREAGATTRGSLVLWGAALCCTAALGVTLEKSLPGLWMIVYASAFAALLLAGIRLEPDEASIWLTPMRTLGGAGLAGLLFLLIFAWPWDGVGWAHWRDDLGFHPWASCFDFALAVALPVAALLLLVRAWRHARARRDGRGLPAAALPVLWGLAPFVTAGAYALAAHREATGLPALVMLVFLGGLGVATLVDGLAARRTRRVNAGVVVLLAVILGKFFSSEVGFTAKGIAFIGCGAVFLAANLLLARQRRKGDGA